MNIHNRLTLTTLEQVRALADPLRLRMLAALRSEPMTTGQVAKCIDQPVTKLYHHMAALEDAGLVKLVDTKRKRGTLERYYQRTARSLSIDRGLLSSSPHKDAGAKSLQALFSHVLEATLAEIEESIETKLVKKTSYRRTSLVARLRIRTTQYGVATLMKKLNLLLKQCQSAQSEEGDLEYGLTLLFYPTVQTGKNVRRKKK